MGLHIWWHSIKWIKQDIWERWCKGGEDYSVRIRIWDTGRWSGLWRLLPVCVNYSHCLSLRTNITYHKNIISFMVNTSFKIRNGLNLQEMNICNIPKWNGCVWAPAHAYGQWQKRPKYSEKVQIKTKQCCSCWPVLTSAAQLELPLFLPCIPLHVGGAHLWGALLRAQIGKQLRVAREQALRFYKWWREINRRWVAFQFGHEHATLSESTNLINELKIQTWEGGSALIDNIIY